MPDREEYRETAGASTPVSERVRLPLLTLITQQSLDEDYQHAAERKAAGGPRPPKGRPPRTAAVVIGVFGLLVATAFVQTTRNAPVQDASRESLISRIEARRDRVAAQEEQVADLRKENAGLEDAASGLADDSQTIEVALRRLEIRTGFIAVKGEGIRITVKDSVGGGEDGEVKDRDLGLLVNGLWESGAEAIAINGQRLTAVSAIRTSGVAIRINGVGVNSPYTVEAIGDTRVLAARLFDTTTGLTFVSTSQVYGFTYDVDDNVQDLSLPAAPAAVRNLRSVRQPGGQGRPFDDSPGETQP
ncbi:DUF881 domain-containing protein [Nocardioides sp. GXZ039]|uniref:DUF881 domain-containing protein n=1 Tax=Nocardioides sp. GXZ039 TaxID=3136018 RepID=UPI0030F46BF1